MPRAAVLGSPIAHSLSPVLHNAGYAALMLEDWEYTKHEVTDLPSFLETVGEDYRGFSVTMPLKFDALKCADIVSERAELIVQLMRFFGRRASDDGDAVTLQ